MANREKKEYGFAAFLDLQDSTYAWDQDANATADALLELARTVEAFKGDKGSIGNFTGDGFLLLYDDAMTCIKSLVAVIDAWEIARQRHIRAYQNIDECFLALRTGVCFGYYLPIVLDRVHVAGPAINMAQRCEAEGRKHFRDKDLFGKIPEKDRPKSHQRIFVDQDVVRGITNKLHISDQLPAQFKGITAPGAEGAATVEESRHIYAVWPKTVQAAGGRRETGKPSPSPSAGLPVFAEGERYLRLGKRLLGIAQTVSGQAKRMATEQAVEASREALKIYRDLKDPLLVAKGFTGLGGCLRAQAELLSGGARKTALDEAVQAYREALRVYTSKTAPSSNARAQNNLGTALAAQAELLSGEAKKTKLDEAVQAYREALRGRTLASASGDYAATQNNLGAALRAQAELLSGEGRKTKLDEAEKAFKEAARAVQNPEVVRTVLFKKRADM